MSAAPIAICRAVLSLCPAETAFQRGVEHLPLVSQQLKQVTRVHVPPWWPHGQGTALRLLVCVEKPYSLSVASFPGSGCCET